LSTEYLPDANWFGPTPDRDNRFSKLTSDGIADAKPNAVAERLGDFALIEIEA